MAQGMDAKGRCFGGSWARDELAFHPDIISDIYERVARRIAMSEKQVNQVSGHSVRVGAAQDLVAMNIDLGSVMQAGRWRSSRMPMRYVESALAAGNDVLELTRLCGDQHSRSYAESGTMLIFGAPPCTDRAWLRA